LLNNITNIFGSRAAFVKIIFYVFDGKNAPKYGWVETNPSNIQQHAYLTSAKAINIVP
jgi:hypothetical protein